MGYNPVSNNTKSFSFSSSLLVPLISDSILVTSDSILVTSGSNDKGLVVAYCLLLGLLQKNKKKNKLHYSCDNVSLNFILQTMIAVSI